jgi:hypothetical protein
VLVITGSILLFATVGEQVAHYRLIQVVSEPEPCETEPETIAIVGALKQEDLILTEVDDPMGEKEHG